MKEKYVAYVGTYTHGSSIGIHLYDVNVEEGTLTERKVIPVNNSSHLAISLNGKYLYSIADEGVAVFSIDPDGDLTFINKVDIDGMRGCHLSTDKEGNISMWQVITTVRLPWYIPTGTDAWEASWTGYSTEDWEAWRRETSVPM